MELAVRQVAALCPAGDLKTLRDRLQSPEKLSARDFQGQCDPGRLKELGELLPEANLRRVPRLARLALRAALEIKTAVPQEALIIISAYGSAAATFDFLDSILSDGAALASPTAFSHSVTNMSAAYLSRHLGLTGPCLSLSQNSFLPALEAAELLLSSGRAESVLVGAISEYSEIMDVIDKAAGREPPVLSDGAVFFELARPAQKRDEVLLRTGEPRIRDNRDERLAGLIGRSYLAEALRLALARLSAGDGGGPNAAGLCGKSGTELIRLQAQGSPL